MERFPRGGKAGKETAGIPQRSIAGTDIRDVNGENKRSARLVSVLEEPRDGVSAPRNGKVRRSK